MIRKEYDMGLFKKKYDKYVTDTNEFLKTYAIKVNGLTLFAESDEAVKAELNAMRDDFQYAVPGASADAKAIEKKITHDFDTLSKTLEKSDYDKAEVLTLIRSIRRSIVEITALR
jgi:hypothetical protein